MTHYWGDEWFEEHGEDLREAENYIGQYVRNTSYCYVHSKEKYGTIRYERLYVPSPRYPDFVIKLPFFKNKTRYGDFDIELFRWSESWIARIWGNYGRKKLKEAVASAVEKWPHLEYELTEDLDIEYM